jgi:hypothetical protein
MYCKRNTYAIRDIIIRTICTSINSHNWKAPSRLKSFSYNTIKITHNNTIKITHNNTIKSTHILFGNIIDIYSRKLIDI